MLNFHWRQWKIHTQHPMASCTIFSSSYWYAQPFACCSPVITHKLTALLTRQLSLSPLLWVHITCGWLCYEMLICTMAATPQHQGLACPIRHTASTDFWFLAYLAHYSWRNYFTFPSLGSAFSFPCFQIDLYPYTPVHIFICLLQVINDFVTAAWALSELSHPVLNATWAEPEQPTLTAFKTLPFPTV